MAGKKKAEPGKEKPVPVFTKEQLLSSARYEKDKDVLMAILEDKSYTETEVKEAIRQFKKGTVE